MKFLPALFFIFIASQSFATTSLEKMASIRVFAFGGIGYAGTTSEGELLFRDLSSGADAKSDFNELLKIGNAQAKCYTLVALRKLDPENYKPQIKHFAQDEDPVSTLGGCLLMTLPMA